MARYQSISGPEGTSDEVVLNCQATSSTSTWLYAPNYTVYSVLLHWSCPCIHNSHCAAVAAAGWQWLIPLHQPRGLTLRCQWHWLRRSGHAVCGQGAASASGVPHGTAPTPATGTGSRGSANCTAI